MNQSTRALLQRTGRILLLFAFRNRFTLLLVAMVLYLLFWPKRVPHISTETSKSTAVQASAALPLYDPGQNDADRKWSLPAELKSDRLQAFAQEVAKLVNDIKKMRHLEDEYETLTGELLNDNVRDFFWNSILNASGFNDPKLPLDWFEVVKDRYGIGEAVAAEEQVQDGLIFEAIAFRLRSILVRIIGGKVLAGDVLAVKSIEAFNSQRLGYFSRVVPMTENVMQRLGNEAPPALQGSVQNSLRNYGVRLQAPEPVRAPRSAREAEGSDLNSTGFKGLRMRMTLLESRALAPSSQITKTDPATRRTWLRLSDRKWLSIKNYPITGLLAEFERDILVQINVTFDSNSHEIYKLFQESYGPLQDSTEDWRRGSGPLKAKCSNEGAMKVFAAILTPIAKNGSGEPQWDEIRLLDPTWLSAMRQANAR